MRMEKVAQHLSLLASNFSPLVTTSGQPQCLTNENFRQAQGLNTKKKIAKSIPRTGCQTAAFRAAAAGHHAKIL